MSGILWHNDSTNESQFWLVDGATFIAQASLLDEDSNPIIVGGPWQVVGVGTDSEAITRPNIVWHDQGSNMILLWRMFNHKIASRAAVIGVDGKTAFVGPPWSIVGVGDFNANGKADILWHNSSTGLTEIWFMDDVNVINMPTVLGSNGAPPAVGDPWSIVGVGDFDANGKADILWHNSSTGLTEIWFMDGERVVNTPTVLGSNGAPPVVGDPWSIVGAHDFNGDGKADILWHNRLTNETQIWFMNGSSVVSTGTVVGGDGKALFLGPPWRIVGAGDFTLGRIGPVSAEGNATTPAGSFKGNVVVTAGGLTVDGNVAVSGDVILQGADYAEALTTTDPDVLPGTVVVLGEDGEIHPCAKEYDIRVAGIVSGAGGVKPALVLDRHENSAHVALMGKVWCYADADHAEIRPGDLLTTSAITGHCQRVTAPEKAFGAVIGKALTPLPDGLGLVRVLVSPR